MSDLVVVAFDDEQTAFQVRDKLARMTKEHLIGLEDLVVVVRHQDGKTDVKQSMSLAGVGALSGSFWGLLIGIIFLMPLLGLAIGAITGALAGHLTDYGIDDAFIKEVSETVKPGSSAVFMLIKEVTPDKFLTEMEEFRGTVVRTSLTEESEAKLREAFGEEVEEKEKVAAPAV
ncbi:putative membrane protein [Methanofollis sp. W23]|uniref:DUF1269 domain-containing protein n=1 Tax=Methanofollis sp. W23 TaxID=2817849 RepID=UPI001AEB2B09|nr:DUF1269 domain-containing protein [Methanofollis sp. W23]MBP2145499.1 putative membrane protein [Methanofollis sp. W23]